MSLALSQGGYFDGTAETFVACDYASGDFAKDDLSRPVTGTPDRSRGAPIVTHTLKAEGHDGSEDGTGRGVPLVAATIGTRCGDSTNNDGKKGSPKNLIVGSLSAHAKRHGHAMGTQQESGQIVAYSVQSQNANIKHADAIPTDTAKCLDGVGFTPNQGGTLVFDERNVTSAANRAACRPGDQVPMAIAFQSSQSGVREVEAHATLDSNNGSRRHNGVTTTTGVRRLTPTECERLQGAPDGWTEFGDDGKRITDSPRYRMIGNGVAVPVVTWIAERIVRTK